MVHISFNIINHDIEPLFSLNNIVSFSNILAARVRASGAYIVSYIVCFDIPVPACGSNGSQSEFWHSTFDNNAPRLWKCHACVACGSWWLAARPVKLMPALKNQDRKSKVVCNCSTWRTPWIGLSWDFKHSQNSPGSWQCPHPPFTSRCCNTPTELSGLDVLNKQIIQKLQSSKVGARAKIALHVENLWSTLLWLCPDVK